MGSKEGVVRVTQPTS